MAVDNMHLQRHQFDGKSYIVAKTLDSEITIFRQQFIVDPVNIDGVLYVECAIGDHILVTYKYNGSCCNKRFKVIGKDSTGLFFICKSDPTEEETVYLDLMQILDKVQKGKMDTEEAHLQADEIIVNLLYQKNLNLIADIYLAIPKWYS